MEVPFDIIYAIGQHCDRNTRLNLCMASKDFYMCDSKWISENQVIHFSYNIRKMLNKFSLKRTKPARIKLAHQVFRFIILNKHVLKCPKLSKFYLVLDSKLKELGETGMCRRKVMKYKKELGL
jgi:hypothetical protein